MVDQTVNGSELNENFSFNVFDLNTPIQYDFLRGFSNEMRAQEVKGCHKYKATKGTYITWAEQVE